MSKTLLTGLFFLAVCQKAFTQLNLVHPSIDAGVDRDITCNHSFATTWRVHDIPHNWFLVLWRSREGHVVQDGYSIQAELRHPGK